MKKEINLLFNRSEITAGTRGASLGPDAIRIAARTRHSDFFSTHKVKEIADRNDALDRPTDYVYARYIDVFSAVFESVSHSVKETLVNKQFPFILAGDHGSGAATIAGIKKAYPSKRLGVIWIDAHGDLHTPFTTPSGNMHGMPLALALGQDNTDCSANAPDDKTLHFWSELKKSYAGNFVQPEDLVFVALRDTEKEENALIDRLDIKCHSVDELREKGATALAQKILEQLSACDLLYVSFDVDSMDPQQTSFGTGTPVKNGLTPQEAKGLILELVNDDRLCCFECVEVNPCLDNQLNRMAEIAFDIIESTVKVIASK